MITPQFATQEYVSAGILNAAAAVAAGDFSTLALAMVTPGLVSAESIILTPAGLNVTANIPAPAGVIFATGILTQAHGVQTNVDTQTYSVSFSGLVPGSGSVTAFLLAGSGQIQQGPYQVVGPPPGHPDYNPNFVAYTAYATLVDTLALTASLTPPDNATTFELARFSIAAAATGVGTSNTAYQVASVPQGYFSPVAVSGAVAVLNTQVGTLFNAVSAATLTLPATPNTNGNGFGFVSSTSGAVSVQVSGMAGIFGTSSNPSSGVTTLALASGNCVIIAARNGQWQIVGGSNFGVTPETTSAIATAVSGLASQTYVSGAITAATSGLAPINNPTFTSGQAGVTPPLVSNNTQLVTTAWVIGRIFVSNNFNIATGGNGSQAHGLPNIPSRGYAQLICTTNLAPFNVGQVIQTMSASRDSDSGVAVWWDATNVYYQIGSNGITLIGNGGLSFEVTNSTNFQLRLIVEL